MTADDERAPCDRPAGQLAHTGFDRFMGQLGFQFAPKLDALKQSAGPIETRLTEAKGRIEMKMAVDEWRCHQAAAGVDHIFSVAIDVFRQPLDAPVANGDIYIGAAIGKIGVANQQVKHGIFLNPFPAPEWHQ